MTDGFGIGVPRNFGRGDGGSWRSATAFHSRRWLHGWYLLAGINIAAPDGLPIWRTWPSSTQTFARQLNSQRLFARQDTGTRPVDLDVALNNFLVHDSPMIATLGEAHDLGWKLTVFCRFGKREGMKSIRACTARADIDLTTLIWTRGRDFPITRLDSRMKCPRCGSRKVLVAFEPPPAKTRMRA